MATVVLVVHPRRPDAGDRARRAAAWLAERGHGVVMPADDAAALGLPELGVGAEALRDTGADADLIVALGGDGTVLRAFRLVATSGTPILGVNLGRLGFLAQIEPPELIAALERFLAGDYRVEERMTVAVSLFRGSTADGPPVIALNEAVVEKPRPGNTIHLAVGVDGRPWVTYAGDGLIVATPTGSTAYSFSARGPVVSPRVQALLLTPVAPHMAFDRSLVVGGSEAVRVEVSDERPAALTIDGRDRGMLRWGDAIVCQATSPPARFVTFAERDFYRVLKTKLLTAPSSPAAER